MRYLLDTSFCIACLRRKPMALASLASVGLADVAVSAITLGELHAGVHLAHDPAAERRKVEAFLRPLPLLAFDREEAIRWAVVEAALRKAGQAIEVPMFETMVAFNLAEHHGGAIYEPPLGDIGYVRALSPFRRPYPCADGWACLMPYTDANWRDFFGFVGRPELADDPRFARHTDRIANSSALYGLLDEFAPTRTVAEWLSFCQEHSIPAAAVMDLAHAHEDAHLLAVDFLPVVEHPTEGPYRAVRDSISYSETPTRLRRHAPTCGQHSREVLTELGWDADRIEAAVQAGAVA